MEHDDADLMEQLLGVGLRVTAPRLAVIRAVAGEGRHRDADTIARIARKSIGALSTQAVYDNLHALAAAGLVRQIEPAGRPTLYETRVGDNHHHLVCRHCGATVDVDCVVGDAPCLEPSATHGFAVDEAEVIFWGACPDCQSKHLSNKEAE